MIQGFWAYSDGLLTLTDQDQHPRATLCTDGRVFYCSVRVRLYEQPIQTTRNRFPAEAMQEAESLLLAAGIEL